MQWRDGWHSKMPLGSVGAGSSSLVMGMKTPSVIVQRTYAAGYTCPIIHRAMFIIEVVPTRSDIHVDVRMVVHLEGLSLCHRLSLFVCMC